MEILQRGFWTRGRFFALAMIAWVEVSIACLTGRINVTTVAGIAMLLAEYYIGEEDVLPTKQGMASKFS